jgi:DNA-directed RNA polymerase beta subunit
MESVMESAIDFPTNGLTTDVWQVGGSGAETPLLRADVKALIFSVLRKYSALPLTQAEIIHITGSIGTNQYEPDADVDIHVQMKPEDLPTDKSPEDWQKDVFKFFRRDENKEFVGTHPIEIYLQLNPNQDFLSDAVYDFVNDEWLKGPKITEPDFDPYEVYGGVMEELRKIVQEADLELGELQRDVIDYEVIQSAVQKIPREYQERLREHLREKLADIEAEIKELMANKKEWVQARRQASQPTSVEQAWNDVNLVKTWAEKNALSKFLSRYGYLRVITDLEKLLEEGPLSGSDVPEVKRILKSR